MVVVAVYVYVVVGGVGDVAGETVVGLLVMLLLLVFLGVLCVVAVVVVAFVVNIAVFIDGFLFPLSSIRSTGSITFRHFQPDDS